jgi:hypothetical protein
MYPDPSASLCPRIADTTVSSIEDTTRTTHFKKNSSKQALHQTTSIAYLIVIVFAVAAIPEIEMER